MGSRWVFRLAHWLAKKHWSDFRERKAQQAIPKLAGIVRDASRSLAERRHAIETLALVAGQRFHHAADPVGAAKAWLRQHSM